VSDLHTVWRACLAVLSEMGDLFDDVGASMHPDGTGLHPYPHVAISYQLAGKAICDPKWIIALNLREQIARAESWSPKNTEEKSVRGKAGG